ncbi:hypothetical protein ACJX0J_015678, partial [Zea mays]
LICGSWLEELCFYSLDIIITIISISHEKHNNKFSMFQIGPKVTSFLLSIPHLHDDVYPYSSLLTSEEGVGYKENGSQAYHTQAIILGKLGLIISPLFHHISRDLKSLVIEGNISGHDTIVFLLDLSRLVTRPSQDRSSMKFFFDLFGDLVTPGAMVDLNDTAFPIISTSFLNFLVVTHHFYLKDIFELLTFLGGNSMAHLAIILVASLFLSHLYDMKWLVEMATLNIDNLFCLASKKRDPQFDGSLAKRMDLVGNPYLDQTLNMLEDFHANIS